MCGCAIALIAHSGSERACTYTRRVNKWIRKEGSQDCQGHKNDILHTKHKHTNTLAIGRYAAARHKQKFHRTTAIELGHHYIKRNSLCFSIFRFSHFFFVVFFFFLPPYRFTLFFYFVPTFFLCPKRYSKWTKSVE